MEIIKVAFIGLAGVVLAVFFKTQKPDFAVFISLVTMLIIAVFIIGRMKVVADLLEKINRLTGSNGEYIKIIIKMIGVTYVAEFTSGICKDCYNAAVSTFVEIFARLSIIIISMPVMMSLLETICSL